MLVCITEAITHELFCVDIVLYSPLEQHRVYLQRLAFSAPAKLGFPIAGEFPAGIEVPGYLTASVCSGPA